MIDPKQLRDRATQLYSDLKKRSRPTYWQSGPRQGKILWPGEDVPYSSEEFAAWLLKAVGYNAFPCPYCNAPLDVLSMVLDHDVALKKGGTNEFSNFKPCCRDCNELKGAMTAKDYVLFRAMLRQLSPAGESDLLKRLRFGLTGMRMSQQANAEKKSAGSKRPAKRRPALAKSAEPF